MENVKWDDESDQQNPGWLVLCRVGGKDEWMPPAPGYDLPQDAGEEEIEEMVTETIIYHLS